MRQRRHGKGNCSRTTRRLLHPNYTQEVQQELTRLLVQWMQALGKAIGAEVSDEQD